MIIPDATRHYEVVFDDGLSVNAPQDRLGLDYDGKHSLKISKPSGPYLDKLTSLRLKVAGRNRDAWLEVPALSGEIALP